MQASSDCLNLTDKLLVPCQGKIRQPTRDDARGCLVHSSDGNGTVRSPHQSTHCATTSPCRSYSSLPPLPLNSLDLWTSTSKTARWQIRVWKRVLVTEGTGLCLFHDGRARVYCCSVEGLAPCCIQEVHPYGGTGVKVLGEVCGNPGKGLVIIRGNPYIQILLLSGKYMLQRNSFGLTFHLTIAPFCGNMFKEKPVLNGIWFQSNTARYNHNYSPT